jgi:NADH:ubiquinone oxidoreductase subunit 2 (subunit N)
MINNLNILLPEIFLTLSIFSILMIGVFIKNSFNLIFNLKFINNFIDHRNNFK